LLKVLENWYDEMFGDYAREVAGARGARARLRLLVWRHLRTVKVHGALCRLVFLEFRTGRDYRDSPVHAANRRYTQQLLNVLEEGVTSGEFRDDIPLTLLRDMIYGGIEHHTWNYLCGRGGIDIERIADEMVEVLCDGIKPRAAKKSAGKK
ncbi:MAG TPA: TetR/AcrR family transcriptional regulator C-terminal domain-containing protein, partial [Nevskiaceae bacterium]|nr:TetR/AcrR family transcriptional regulator C-terminal domain-containing protein [Nevskiaceae bacterium]